MRYSKLFFIFIVCGFYGSSAVANEAQCTLLLKDTAEELRSDNTAARSVYVEIFSKDSSRNCLITHVGKENSQALFIIGKIFQYSDGMHTGLIAGALGYALSTQPRKVMEIILSTQGGTKPTEDLLEFSCPSVDEEYLVWDEEDEHKRKELISDAIHELKRRFFAVNQVNERHLIDIRKACAARIEQGLSQWEDLLQLDNTHFTE